MTEPRKARKPTPKQLRTALATLRSAMHCYCSEYNDQTGVQCPNIPVWTLSNSKMDTESHWCEEHKPSREHYADSVDAFEGAQALATVQRALDLAQLL